MELAFTALIIAFIEIFLKHHN